MRILTIGVLALTAAGCAAGPNYSRPAVETPTAYYGQPAQAAPAELARWWVRFDDPVLQQLVADVEAGNLDLKVAAARLIQARESVVQARAGALPSVGVSATIRRNVDPDVKDTTAYSAGASAAWEIDLFGRIRRGVEAARADAEGAYFDQEAVRVSIAAETASTYIQARLAQDRLALAREDLQMADQNLQIADWRVQAGLVSSLDLERARTQRAQTAASIPTLEASYANAADRLAVLTGRAPGALRELLAAPRPVPLGPSDIAAGIPADVIRQRPDVRSAERSLASATARIGVAEAQLYPALSLSGNIGTTAFSIGGLADVVTGSILGGLDQSIFEGGRLRSQVRAQRAVADAALSTYRQSVLTALEDVQNALAALDAAKRRQTEFTAALNSANNTAILARSQYRAGLVDFTTLLDAERSLNSARDGLAVSRGDQASALVQLYRALGGGWTPQAAPQSGSSNERL
jgi:multidrug efflux system outer membrane protein